MLKRTVQLLLFASLITTSLRAADNPFVGKWKLNGSKRPQAQPHVLRALFPLGERPRLIKPETRQGDYPLFVSSSVLGELILPTIPDRVVTPNFSMMR